jgi:hypothetical protein
MDGDADEEEPEVEEDSDRPPEVKEDGDVISLMRGWRTGNQMDQGVGRVARGDRYD